ncbi:MAG: hypothetical protein ABIA21_03985 [Candidatus Aenigmatarchaeota archaeon]
MVLEMIGTDMIIFMTSFLFMFAIVFALLSYAKIFKETRYACAIIAAVIGLISAIYAPFTFFIQSVLPVASIVLVIIFFIVFIKAIFTHDKEKGKKSDMAPTVIVLAILLIVLAAMWPMVSTQLGIAVSLSENILWVIGLIVLFIIFVTAYKMQTEGIAPAGS